MKINKDKIRNINKKILGSGLALLLLTTPLQGCSSMVMKDIEYATNEQGYVQEFEGNIDYDVLRYCSFCQVTNLLTDETYYTIVVLPTKLPATSGHDLFTNQDISKGFFEIKIIVDVEDWFVNYNLVKKEYSHSDLKEILDSFQKNIEEIAPELKK